MLSRSSYICGLSVGTCLYMSTEQKYQWWPETREVSYLILSICNRDIISTVVPMFLRLPTSKSFMPARAVIDRQRNFKTTTLKPEVNESRVLELIWMKFERLYQCFPDRWPPTDIDGHGSARQRPSNPKLLCFACRSIQGQVNIDVELVKVNIHRECRLSLWSRLNCWQNMNYNKFRSRGRRTYCSFALLSMRLLSASTTLPSRRSSDSATAKT